MACFGFRKPSITLFHVENKHKRLHDYTSNHVRVKWTHRSRQFFSEFKLCRLLSLQLVGAAP